MMLEHALNVTTTGKVAYPFKVSKNKSVIGVPNTGKTVVMALVSPASKASI